MKYRIEIEGQDLNYIGHALQDKPYREVHKLIEDLKQQAAAIDDYQARQVASAPVPESQPVTVATQGIEAPGPLPTVAWSSNSSGGGGAGTGPHVF